MKYYRFVTTIEQILDFQCERFNVLISDNSALVVKKKKMNREVIS